MSADSAVGLVWMGCGAYRGTAGIRKAVDLGKALGKDRRRTDSRPPVISVHDRYQTLPGPWSTTRRLGAPHPGTLSTLQLSPAREAEVVEELSQHLEDRWRELIDVGKPPQEAARLALADLREGNMLARSMAPLCQSHVPPAIAPALPDPLLAGGLWRDIRYAARLWREQPGFVLTAVLTLALAIGATTALFTVVDATLVRALPFPEADRLVQLGAAIHASQHRRRRSSCIGASTRATCSRTGGVRSLGSGFNLVGGDSPIA